MTARTPEGSFEPATRGFTMTSFPAEGRLSAAEGSDRPDSGHAVVGLELVTLEMLCAGATCVTSDIRATERLPL